MRALIVTLMMACALLVAQGSSAQGDASSAGEAKTEQDPTEERAAQFVGVEGPDAERIPGGPLLLAAYAVAWALIFLFLLRMRKLQRQTADELERLRSEIRSSGRG
jgi:CcmD family protein